MQDYEEFGHLDLLGQARHVCYKSLENTNKKKETYARTKRRYMFTAGLNSEQTG